MQEYGSSQQQEERKRPEKQEQISTGQPSGKSHTVSSAGFQVAKGAVCERACRRAISTLTSSEKGCDRRGSLCDPRRPRAPEEVLVKVGQ